MNMNNNGGCGVKIVKGKVVVPVKTAAKPQPVCTSPAASSAIRADYVASGLIRPGTVNEVEMDRSTRFTLINRGVLIPYHCTRHLAKGRPATAR